MLSRIAIRPNGRININDVETKTNVKNPEQISKKEDSKLKSVRIDRVTLENSQLEFIDESIKEVSVQI